MIGIFDSGVGGLTVLSALEKILPNEGFLYFADTAHFPYGEKQPAEILRFSSEAVAFLLSKGAEMVIIACHTASAHALEELQKNFPIPIIGMVAPTVELIKKGPPPKKIGIMATRATLESEKYQEALKDQFPDCVFYLISCPELEKKIEKGYQNIQESIQACLAQILGQQVDILVLACTHYPHIQHQIEEELDPETKILNPSLAVAETAAKQLKNPQSKGHKPHHLFYVSGDLIPFLDFLRKSPPQADYELFPFL